MFSTGFGHYAQTYIKQHIKCHLIIQLCLTMTM